MNFMRNMNLCGIRMSACIAGALLCAPGLARAQFQTNGSAMMLPSGTFRFTNNGGNQTGSAFSTGQVSISTFNVTFQTHLFGPEAIADGVTFTIQNAPAGASALGGSGGDLGYAGISNSVAVKFDTFNNGEPSANTTGMFTNGAGPFGGIDLTPSGVNLHQDFVDVGLVYDGTTLTETLHDEQTGSNFSTAYTVDIPTIVGSNVAYVGFTGSTGAGTSTQDINVFNFPGLTSPLPVPEPGTLALLTGAGVTLGGTLLRRRRKA